VLPVFRERAAYLERNAELMQETADAFADESQDLIGLVQALRSAPLGRVYAGDRTNWGKEYRIGRVPVYDVLVAAGLDTVAPLNHPFSLNFDLLYFFDQHRAEQYDLFNIRYLVAPADQSVPEFVKPIQDFGRHRLYQVETSGYFDLVGSDSDVAFRGDKSDLLPAAFTWLTGGLPGAKEHPTVSVGESGTGAERLVPLSGAAGTIAAQSAPDAPPRGRVISERVEPGGYGATVEVERDSVLMLKATYHPNWLAYVDGVEAGSLMLMPSYVGVRLGPGQHDVRLEYRSGPLRPILILFGLLTLIAVGLIEWQRPGIVPFIKPPRAPVASPPPLAPPARALPAATPHRAEAPNYYMAATLALQRTGRAMQDNSIVLMLLVGAFCILGQRAYGLSSRGVDFYQYWVVGQALPRAGGESIYSERFQHQIGLEFLDKAQAAGSPERQRIAAERRSVVETYQSPFLYTVFRAFSSGDYERDYQIFLLVCLAATALAIVALCRWLDYSLLATFAAIVGFTQWFEPLRSDLRVGNVNQIELGLLVLSLWLLRKHTWRPHAFLGGLVLALSLMFKPNVLVVPIMLGVSWLINRRFEQLARVGVGFVTGCIAAIGVSALLFGSIAPWGEWVLALTNLPDSITTVSQGNYAIARTIEDLSGVRLSGILMAATLAAAVILVWIGRRKPEAGLGRPNQTPQQAWFDDLLMLGVGAVIYLLAGRLVWLHYLVGTIPLTLLVLRPLRSDAVTSETEIVVRRALAAVALIAIAGDPIQTVLPLDDPHFASFLSAIGLSLLLALAAWELVRPARGRRMSIATGERHDL
jgi:hypothetical protein